MKRMSKEAEKKLLRSVEEVISSVSDGVSPTDALCKVAEANEYSTAEVRRLAEAYNQSRTLHQFDKESDAARMKTFPLADPDSVIDRLYPATTEATSEKVANVIAAESLSWTPVSRDFVTARKNRNRHDAIRSSLNLEKKANDETNPTLERLEKQACFSQLAEKKAQLADQSEQLNVQMQQIGEALRTNFDRDAFRQIEVGIVQQYGEKAAAFLDHIYREAGLDKLKAKRASQSDFDSSRFTLTDLIGLGGYGSVESLIKSAINLHSLQKDVRTLESQLSSFDHTPAIEKTASAKEETKSSIFSKEADGFFPISSRVIAPVKADISKYTAPDSFDEKNRAVYDNAFASMTNLLADPTAVNDLAQIKTKAMLTDFMANDEVIANYDDDEILDAFNQLQVISPDIVSNPILARDLLRRYLETGGEIDMFTAEQAAKAGQGMSDARRSGASDIKQTNPYNSPVPTMSSEDREQKKWEQDNKVEAVRRENKELRNTIKDLTKNTKPNKPIFSPSGTFDTDSPAPFSS